VTERAEFPVEPWCLRAAASTRKALGRLGTTLGIKSRDQLLQFLLQQL
jgi:hypothetical protein